MLVNTDIYLCSQFKSSLKPISEQFKISLIPHNLERTSKHTFMFCDGISEKPTYGNIANYRTRIIERDILHNQEKIIEEFQGRYSSWGFCNDYALLLNDQGDFLFYNMLNKNVFQAQKQHPGQYLDAEILHTDEHFITCGGCVKNQITGNPERIIKIWSIDNADCLVQSCRINTGHTRAIQHSFLINKTHVVSLSSDKSIRFTNIITTQIDSIIRTQTQFLSGCQIDFNSVLAGGLGKQILCYDRRLNRKIGNINIKIPRQMIQVTCMKRFTDNYILVANINEIFLLDLRNWKLELLAEYEGERISSFLALNEKDLIIGNREKTIQVWEAS